MNKWRVLAKKGVRKVKELRKYTQSVRQVKRNSGTKPIALAFYFSHWKQECVKEFFREYEIIFIPHTFTTVFLHRLLRVKREKVFLIWGSKQHVQLEDIAEAYQVPIYRVEDGFVRSVGLGALHTLPYSLCIDKTGIYYDSTQPSDLEHLLNHHHFDQDILDRAARIIEEIKENGLSKYNHLSTKDVNVVYGRKANKRILVIGQVEDDASIMMGAATRWTNNDLVRLAREENPHAQIIYKPHPDVLSGKRPLQSNPKDVTHLAQIVSEPISLHDSLKTVDHVYTITSLSGFEALMRGIPVTTVGAPFYSNWGLTDDRQMVARRRRQRTLVEVFAAAYLLYPKYMNPNTKEPITLEETIQLINEERNAPVHT
ncbi:MULTISPECIES: capsular polysaccharide export protein, LipB/KpsS family [Cytobacillus]|uniref:capsular polysaccharide export protein, LipB/KpsS family n=1 Tax=Cytobacillus TaxID=2675230 RepID=UPI001CD6118E|nr:capsular polysaccharide biosynthesis protein [Cytobacillus kochii]MCA1026847.1 capsular polysaccharide biosynthesis protein [Cytobacillus kochii]MCM3322731.1 capsular polysaccharide biosynthesis protein [Cytobacillus kochii]MCM3344790.1 capsular polysaccharide biosynthesis protein [Cytobacillus kochii]